MLPGSFIAVNRLFSYQVLCQISGEYALIVFIVLEYVRLWI